MGVLAPDAMGNPWRPWTIPSLWRQRWLHCLGVQTGWLFWLGWPVTLGWLPEPTGLRLGWLDCAGWAEPAGLGLQAELAGQADMLDWAAIKQEPMYSHQVLYALQMCLAPPCHNVLKVWD